MAVSPLPKNILVRQVLNLSLAEHWEVVQEPITDMFCSSYLWQCNESRDSNCTGNIYETNVHILMERVTSTFYVLYCGLLFFYVSNIYMQFCTNYYPSTNLRIVQHEVDTLLRSCCENCRSQDMLWKTLDKSHK